MNLIPIVLSGGSGTRLWPMSRTTYPKQFCNLLNESLQTLTLKRLKDYEPSVIITSDKLATLTQTEISENKFSVEKIIFEPAAKNTAAAIAVACRYLELKGLVNEVVGVFSSDALVLNEPAFHEAVKVARAAALKNKIAILGIRPDRVETGFGYIQVASDALLNAASSVLKFHEKPTFEVAEKFIQSGNYFWNAGIFIFKVGEMIQLFKTHRPDIWNLVQTYDGTESKLKEIYSDLKSISIDFAIIEKLNSENLICVPCDIGWSDLGSWDVMDQISSKNVSGSGIRPTNFVKPFEVNGSGNSVFAGEKKM
jgi:mannose-1-phosphate guanylyltransferase/mannose-6-phosphate isomerase